MRSPPRGRLGAVLAVDAHVIVGEVTRPHGRHPVAQVEVDADGDLAAPSASNAASSSKAIAARPCRPRCPRT